jgi:hypothetical protein
MTKMLTDSDDSCDVQDPVAPFGSSMQGMASQSSSKHTEMEHSKHTEIEQAQALVYLHWEQAEGGYSCKVQFLNHHPAAIIHSAD